MGTTHDMIRSSARSGGAVRRYHTWPVIHQQTVAEHSWNLARILHTIWPDAPVGAILHAIYHDVGEVATGDIPFPVKRENPDLKVTMDRLEVDAMLSMGISYHIGDIELWHKRAKICDMIEMWEFGQDELLLGNHHARPIVEKTYQVILEMANDGSGALFSGVWTYTQRRHAWFLECFQGGV